MMRTARILPVDGEVSIQRAVVPLLRSRGYDVETAGTGSDALKAVAEHAPDLVVLDLGLPDYVDFANANAAFAAVSSMNSPCWLMLSRAAHPAAPTRP